MTSAIPFRKQQGIVLVVGMVLLVLITLLVTTAYRMSATNLTAVGNMQFRAQALSAAEVATERVLGLPVMTTAFAVERVDLNGDGTPEYEVSIARSCMRAAPISNPPTPGGGSSVSLGFGSGASEYIGLFDYVAAVLDTATGAKATIHQGFKVRLSQAQCDTLCAPAASQPCN